VQAAFNAPPEVKLPTTAPDVNLVDVEVTSPWRSPQISQAVASAPAPSAPLRIALPGGEPGGMGVHMRAVPSPPAGQPGPATPRIRLPGYNVPQNFSNAHLPPGTVIYYAAPMMPGYQSAPQSAPPNPLSVVSMRPEPISQDGFRPRTAMR
jgi:hypothetical protein